jgi:hypothetical protein
MPPVRPLVLCLAAIPLAPTAGADPIPFDPAKAKASIDRDRAWMADAARAAYRAGGRTSPKWDADAETAIRAAAEAASAPSWTLAGAEARLTAALDSAAEAGCDDPLIVYLRGSTFRGEKAPDPIGAAVDLGASKYPPIWKAQAYLSALVANRQTDDDVRAKLLDNVVRELGRLAEDKSPTARRQLAAFANRVHGAGAAVGKRKAWFDRVDADVLAGLPKTEPVRDLCAGQFLVQYAWDARGGGVASTVTPDGWRRFKERLGEAEGRLKAAWDLDPKCGASAAEMVSVCIGLGRDRDEMETWFRRAVETDQARNKVFERKLEYLHPKWHGSAEELQAFLKEIAALEAWDTDLPLLVLQGVIASSPQGKAARRDHFADSWADVGPLLEGMRKRHPKSPAGASAYLYFAWQAERNAAEAWEYVKAQELPLRLGFFGDPLRIEAARSWAEGQAGNKD